MDYDVLVIGGALSGAAAATLIRRECPDARVLIVEKGETFGRRVGEATVEVSGYFLSRILGLTYHLNECHLPKQGLRFWFSNQETQSLGDSSEIGARYQVRLPSWQVDRAVLDEEVLRRAVAAGAELLRPARVTDVELNAGGLQRVTISSVEGTRVVTARWIVDASGVAALLARKFGWLKMNDAHPTASAWARWRGVKDWDGADLAAKYPQYAAACYGIRHTATNHLMGEGWWSWWIPLKGGDVSVGVVFDQRIVNWSEGEGSIPEKLRAFLSRHPVGKEMLADAEPVEGDAHWRKNLAYISEKFAGDGFVLVGDAAAFLDPFYSPGMDTIAFSVSTAVKLITSARKGEPVETLVEMQNKKLGQSYVRWFEAVYKDKYEYMGDFELMALAFRLDLGLYYLGIVSQPFRLGIDAYQTPPFSNSLSGPAFHLMRTYNRRFAAIGRERRRTGKLGMRNTGERLLIPGFTLNRSDSRRIVPLLLSWLSLELREGWRTWFRSSDSGEDVGMRVPSRPLA